MGKIIQFPLNRNFSEARKEFQLLKDEKLIEYDSSKLGRLITYFNTFTRQFQMHINPAADPSFGFDHCHDCMHEYSIWSDYFDKYGTGDKKTFIISAVKQLHNNEMRLESHGYLFDNSDKTILKMFMKSSLDRILLRMKGGRSKLTAIEKLAAQDLAAS